MTSDSSGANSKTYYLRRTCDSRAGQFPVWLPPWRPAAAPVAASRSPPPAAALLGLLLLRRHLSVLTILSPLVPVDLLIFGDSAKDVSEHTSHLPVLALVAIALHVLPPEVEIPTMPPSTRLRRPLPRASDAPENGRRARGSFARAAIDHPHYASARSYDWCCRRDKVKHAMAMTKTKNKN